MSTGYSNRRPELAMSEALTLSQSYYTDPAWFQREMEAIHFDMWLCAGRAAQIPQPGDYFVRRIANASVIITPLDLEEVYGLTGGQIFHGDLALDQFFTMRPLLDWARYKTPIQNLYLCGSGTHPGAGLTGGSGANAVREILKELKR